MTIPTPPCLPRVFRIVCIAAVALGAAACATVPITGRQAMRLVPDDMVNGMGQQAYDEMRSKSRGLTSRLQLQVVEQIAMSVAEVSGEKFRWEVTVFDDPRTVNAFCMPGGKMGVYTGILPVAQTEAGLAAIMGHEVAHAVARHGSERLSQELIVKVGITVASLSLHNNRYHDLILGALGLGTKLGVLLPYSRVHESEADRMGLEYMARAGYDPREAVELWKRMARLGDSGPEFLSTHPDPLSRAQQIEGWLPDVLPLYEQSKRRASRLLPHRGPMPAISPSSSPHSGGMAFDKSSGTGGQPSRRSGTNKKRSPSSRQRTQPLRE